MKAALISIALAGSATVAGGCTTAHQAWTVTKLSGGVMAAGAATIVMCGPLHCSGGGDFAPIEFTSFWIGIGALVVGIPSVLAALHYTYSTPPPAPASTTP